MGHAIVISALFTDARFAQKKMPGWTWQLCLILHGDRLLIQHLACCKVLAIIPAPSRS